MIGTFKVIIYHNIDSTKQGSTIKIKEENRKSKEVEEYMKQLWFTYLSFLCNVTFIFLLQCNHIFGHDLFLYILDFRFLCHELYLC